MSYEESTQINAYDEGDRSWYFLSAVPRNSLKDWGLTLTFMGCGRRMKVDGKEFTYRYSPWLNRHPALRNSKIRGLRDIVETSKGKGHEADYFLSEQEEARISNVVKV